VTKALVFGGGGLTGIAWSIGLLAGLARDGVDLSETDLVVGTSAGSVVGAQFANRVPLEEQYEAQLAGTGSERSASASRGTTLAMAGALVRSWRDPLAFRARIGRIALAADTVPEADRKAVIAARLTVPTWPSVRLRLAAVDALTGELVAFDRDSGVDLVDAVAASCAIPGIWPPSTVAGRRYVDGGIASGTNAQLAAGSDTVLIVAPSAVGGGPVPSARAEAEALRRGGSKVLLVTPDKAARQASGRNPIDPAMRAPAARGGRAQAASVAAAVREFWAG
jgi:NTE family protein